MVEHSLQILAREEEAIRTHPTTHLPSIPHCMSHLDIVLSSGRKTIIGLPASEFREEVQELGKAAPAGLVNSQR